MEDKKLELYNLAEDPYEQINLSKKNKQQTDNLKLKLDNWRKAINAQMPEKKQ